MHSSDRRTRAWVEVRAEAVRRNYRRVRVAAGGNVGMIPMVKADAYGLGVDRMVTTDGRQAVNHDLAPRFAYDIADHQDPHGFSPCPVSSTTTIYRAIPALP